MITQTMVAAVTTPRAVNPAAAQYVQVFPIILKALFIDISFRASVAVNRFYRHETYLLTP